MTWRLAFSRRLPEGSEYWTEHCVCTDEGEEVGTVVQRLQPAPGMPVWVCLSEACEAGTFCPHVRWVSEYVTMNGGMAECMVTAANSAGPGGGAPPCGPSIAVPSSRTISAPTSATVESCTAPSGKRAKSPPTAPPKPKNPRRIRVQREALYAQAWAGIPEWLKERDTLLETFMETIRDDG